MQPLSPTYRHGDQQRELCRIPASDACVCVHVWGLSHGLSHESCTTFSPKKSRTVIYNKCPRVASGRVRSDVKHVQDPTLMPRANMDPLFGTALLFICVWACVHKDLVIWIHFFDHALDTSCRSHGGWHSQQASRKYRTRHSIGMGNFQRRTAPHPCVL